MVASMQLQQTHNRRQMIMTSTQANSAVACPMQRSLSTVPLASTSVLQSNKDHIPLASGPRASLTVRHLTSLAQIAREDWDRMFAGRVEGWDYFRACELTAQPSVANSVLVAFEGNLPVAAVLLFQIRYRLDMDLPDGLRPVVSLVGRVLPDLVRVKVLGMGSPLTEECPIGFHPRLSTTERSNAFAALLDAMHSQSVLQGVSMLALKDVTDEHSTLIAHVMIQRGFTRVPTLPVATLHLPFNHADQYLATLSPNMRRDLRRKLKNVGKVTVEVCHSIAGIEAEIVELFRETKAKCKVDYDGFDDVPAEYFPAVIASLGDKALIVLCRVDGVLAGFSLSLIEQNRVIGKYVGMRYPLAREHDVYFINWMAVVCYCIAHGITWLQTGQTTYKQKIRLGCQLKRSWVYFKHRGRVLGPVVRSVGSRLRFDLLDPDLATEAEALPYLSLTPPSPVPQRPGD